MGLGFGGGQAHLTRLARISREWTAGAAMPEDQAYAKVLGQIEKARKTHATSLDLFGLELKTLPPDIGQLSSLQSLHVGENQLGWVDVVSWGEHGT